MSQTFFHDLANLLAIASGKAKQADKLMSMATEPEKLQAAHEKLKSTIQTLERMEARLKIEKTASEERKEPA